MEREKSGDLGYDGIMTYRHTYGKLVSYKKWTKKASDRREGMIIKREAKVKLKDRHTYD